MTMKGYTDPFLVKRFQSPGIELGAARSAGITLNPLS